MSDKLTELRSGVEYIDAELRNIHESAGDEPLDADTDARFNEGLAERDRLAAAADALEARHAAAARIGQRPAGVEGGSAPEHTAPAFHRDVNPFDAEYRRQVGDREAAKRAIGQDAKMDDEGKGKASALLARSTSTELRGFERHVLEFGSDDYANAFAKASLGQEAEMTDSERGAWQRARAESRAMGLTDGSGGYTIPTFLDPTIIDTREGTLNPLRMISRVVQITGDNWNGVTSAGVTVAYGTEFSVPADGSPAFQQPSITPAKGSGVVPISIEGYEDITQAGAFVAQSFADKRDDLDATKMVTGSGTAEPKGIVTALAALASRQQFNATNSAIVAQDLFDIQQALGPRYRSRASWLMNLNYVNRIRALGSSDNYFAQTVQLPDGASFPLLGRPLYEGSGITGDQTTSTNNFTVFGDFQEFVIVDRVGLSVEFIPHLFDPTTGRPNGSRAWYVHWRTGSDVVNNTAFVLGVSPNTAYL